MSTRPDRLNDVQRTVIALRAVGMSMTEIAERLGYHEQTVRRIMSQCYRLVIPGVTDVAVGAMGYRLTYVLGLLDAGVDPRDVPRRLVALEQRAAATVTAIATDRTEATA